MKASTTQTHQTAERLLGKYGWRPLRQIEPTKNDRIGNGEFFELWERLSGEFTQLCFVHFYGDGNGVEFYVKGTHGNDWQEVERLLNAPPSLSKIAVLTAAVHQIEDEINRTGQPSADGWDKAKQAVKLNESP